jgi:outer membrane protein OmpA-like peptidoglycan-associated protein
MIRVLLMAMLAMISPAKSGEPHVLSAQEIVEQLSRRPDLGLTRSLPVGRGVSVEAATTAVEQPSVDLEVNFPFNSAALTTDAMLTLDQLGLALTDPMLAGGNFQIAGHTDAKGTDAYNQKLSEERAATVVAYIVNKYHVGATHLTRVGFGERQLRDPDHPEAAVNRRVQVTRLDD